MDMSYRKRLRPLDTWPSPPHICLEAVAQRSKKRRRRKLHVATEPTIDGVLSDRIHNVSNEVRDGLRVLGARAKAAGAYVDNNTDVTAVYVAVSNIRVIATMMLDTLRELQNLVKVRDRIGSGEVVDEGLLEDTVRSVAETSSGPLPVWLQRGLARCANDGGNKSIQNLLIGLHRKGLISDRECAESAMTLQN